MKMNDRLDNGVWIYVGNDIYVSAFENRAYEKGASRFGMTWHKGEMPAYDTKGFDTIESLFEAMREVKDLRCWKDCE